MNIRYPNYKKQEDQLYDKIRELSEEFERQNNAGKDITDIIQKLGNALEALLLFRQQEGGKDIIENPNGTNFKKKAPKEEQGDA